MREMHLSDVVGIASLLLLALLVALFGGFLDPLIGALNENSGAVMGIASLITAAATVFLVLMNRASWKLYELERDRVEANELRIAESCRRLKALASGTADNWRKYLRMEPNDQPEKAEQFDDAFETSRRRLNKVEKSEPQWRRETRRPDTVEALTRVRRAREIADMSLRLRETKPPEDRIPDSLNEAEDFAKDMARKFDRLEDALESVESASRGREG